MEFNHGLGWIPDYPDHRDYTVGQDEVPPDHGQQAPVRAMLERLGIADAASAGNEKFTDLRPWCSPVENQGNLGSCTAQAAAGMVEYFMRKTHGKFIDLSRLFIYKTTRNLLGWTGDRGAFLRTTMGALTLFGAPPEQHWPYDVKKFDDEPSSFCYAFAQNYQAVSYYRLDPLGISRQDLLQRIKANLEKGLPAMFGFAVYSSITQARDTGHIPYPASGDRMVGGHAVMAVGYYDEVEVRNENGGEPTQGAILIRNSWGRHWGHRGYGWLPYKYVLEGQAIDWWSIIKNEWIDTGAFS